MSKNISVIKWLLAAAPFAALLSSCVIPANRGALSGVEHVIISASEEEENAKDREGRRRRGTSTKRFTGSPCGDDDDCYDICEDIFNADDDSENEGKVRACARTNKKYVLQFEEINEAFEDPEHISELELIDEPAFKAMMGISVSPWVEMTESASEDEAKILLVWVAKSKRIAKAIVEAQENYEGYDAYEGIKNLLEQIRRRNRVWNGSSDSDSCKRYVNSLGLIVDNRPSPASPYDFTIQIQSVKISSSKSFKDIYKKESNTEAEEICKDIFNDCRGLSGVYVSDSAPTPAPTTASDVACG